MKSYMLLLWIVITSPLAMAPKVTLPAIRAAAAPKIDGDLSDACWQNIPIATSFITFAPAYGKQASSAIPNLQYLDRVIISKIT
ncbi:MAG: hypothetical protein ABIO98_02455 [Chitinophagales bacterium]